MSREKVAFPISIRYSCRKMVKQSTISAVMKALSKRATEARKRIPKERRTEIARKAAQARWKANKQRP